MAVTMREIAQRAGCSIATVSKVVNRRDQHISEPTRQRILALVEEVGYRPNTLAKSLRMRHTSTIGFILPDIAHPFFAAMARGVEDVVMRHGMAVLFYDTHNDPALERDCVTFMRAKMVDGIIVSGFLLRDVPPEELDDNTPTVLLGKDVFHRRPGTGWVYTDTQAISAEATRLLLDKGCRRVGLLSARAQLDLSRLIGYTQALRERGLEVQEELFIGGCADLPTGTAGARILIQRGVDGIVCTNDLAAYGALAAARDARLAIPDRLKVVGIEDTFLSQVVSPGLTAFHQPAYQMGQSAAEMLVDHISSGAALRTLELPYRFTPRGSI